MGNDQDSQDIVQIHRVLRAAQERIQLETINTAPLVQQVTKEPLGVGQG